MKTHYVCPRCRAEGLSQDCGQPGSSFEVEVTLKFPIPVGELNPSLSPTEAMDMVQDLLTTGEDHGHERIIATLREALHEGDFTLELQPVFLHA